MNSWTTWIIRLELKLKRGKKLNSINNNENVTFSLNFTWNAFKIGTNLYSHFVAATPMLFNTQWKKNINVKLYSPRIQQLNIQLNQVSLCSQFIGIHIFFWDLQDINRVVEKIEQKNLLMLLEFVICFEFVMDNGYQFNHPKYKDWIFNLKRKKKNLTSDQNRKNMERIKKMLFPKRRHSFWSYNKCSSKYKTDCHTI